MFHIGMTLAQVNELPDDLNMLTEAWQTIQDVLTLPTITEEQIEQLEIPEGMMYAPWSGTLNGVPSRGRLVQTREGQDTVVSVRYNTQHLADLQGRIEQRIGRYTMMKNLI